MRTLRWFSALAALALAACGGGSDCGTSFANTCATTTTGAAVASVLVVSDTASIPTDNSRSANITAYVRDANNNFISGVKVIFTADSGGVTVSQDTTDANGVAKAALSTLSDKTNRTITVTATASKVVGSATVNVGGTTVQVAGPIALTTGQAGTYTVTVSDSGKNGIANTPVTLTVPGNLTVGTAPLTTDPLGHATFTATGGASGPGDLVATALGIPSAPLTVTVNGDALTFTTPAAGTQIDLNTPTVFTVNWLQNGVVQVNKTINFATTRGCIRPTGNVATTCAGLVANASGVTDASGNASITVLSDNAGGATVTATTTTTPAASTSVSAQFIAVAPNSIEVQPTVFTLAPNAAGKSDQQSTIAATVRDANNNLVTNATVVFTLNDTSGGYLTTASDITNLQGTASTVYVSGTSPSAANGVKVTATVQSNPAINKTVSLTVAKRQAFISIGTGNTIIANASGTQYQKDYVVQVTDSSGAGVQNVPLAMSVLSDFYFKGYRTKAGSGWSTCYTFPSDTCANGGPGPTISPLVAWGCQDEDRNRNGILDPGEDNNQNGLIEAGNIALVSPSSATTDANGFAIVSVFYPEEYAYYLQVTLQAQATVQGTAFSAQSVFVLPGKADDFNDLTKAPPGIVSPFGRSNSCTDTL